MEKIEFILGYIVLTIEIVSAGILLIGFIKAALGFIRAEIRGMRGHERRGWLAQVRLTLGTYILLGLDFYIVSDIIHSMIRPDMNQLINLLLIVVMRTTIGFFLSKEITEIEKSQISVNE